VFLTAGMLWAERLSWLGWKTWKRKREHSISTSWQHHGARLLLHGGM